MNAPRPRQAQADDFVVLYTRHEQELFRFVASIVPLRADAEDVAQNAARVLWEKFAEYDPSRPFLPWAYTIARFEALNYLQHMKTHHKHFSAQVVEHLADQRANAGEQLAAERTALARCLEKLTTSERDLLDTRYRDPASLSDQAKKLNCNVNALYKRLGRIRGKLADCVRRTMSQEGWS